MDRSAGGFSILHSGEASALLAERLSKVSVLAAISSSLLRSQDSLQLLERSFRLLCLELFFIVEGSALNGEADLVCVGVGGLESFSNGFASSVIARLLG